LNVYSTAYGVILENVLLVAPPMVLTQVGYVYFSGRYNETAWILAEFSQVGIFLMGHCGFYYSDLMYAVNPTGGLQQAFKITGFIEPQLPEEYAIFI
jgi:hypothetical protein